MQGRELRWGSGCGPGCQGSGQLTANQSRSGGEAQEAGLCVSWGSKSPVQIHRLAKFKMEREEHWIPELGPSEWGALCDHTGHMPLKPVLGLGMNCFSSSSVDTKGTSVLSFNGCWGFLSLFLHGESKTTFYTKIILHTSTCFCSLFFLFFCSFFGNKQCSQSALKCLSTSSHTVDLLRIFFVLGHPVGI